MLAHFKLRLLICAVCTAIFGIGAFISLSIPYNTSPYYCHIAEIQFNEAMFTGSVNEFPVQDIMALRLGIWAGSYDDSNNTDRKMPGAFGYMIDITLDSDNSTRTIQVVEKWRTLCLLCTVFLLISTLFTCCHAYLPIPCIKFWIVEGAIGLLSALSFCANGFLFMAVQTEMQKLGETIVSKTGPAAYFLIVIIDILAILAILLNRYLRKQLAKPAQAKDGGGPQTYRLTNNPAAITTLQQQPQGLPLTAQQRVQALMPPRNAPAAPQRVQAPAPTPATYVPRSGYIPGRHYGRTSSRRPRARYRHHPQPTGNLVPDPIPAANASIHNSRSAAIRQEQGPVAPEPFPRRKNPLVQTQPSNPSSSAAANAWNSLEVMYYPEREEFYYWDHKTKTKFLNHPITGVPAEETDVEHRIELIHKAGKARVGFHPPNNPPDLKDIPNIPANFEIIDDIKQWWNKRYMAGWDPSWKHFRERQIRLRNAPPLGNE